MKTTVLLYFVTIISICLFSKNNYAQVDSITLTYKKYLENIINYHPVAKKADLKIRLANAETLAAKGNLDPQVEANWNQKNFEDKLYYQNYEAKLKLPTKLGIDVTGGYENSNGNFVNPENKIDNWGLWFLGVEVNVLQGLFVNNRTTALKQAKVFQQLAQNEQQIILNDLVYDAATAYLIWQLYYQNNAILENNTSIANTYFQNTKQTYLNGEKTAMDTLEAYILYQDAIGFLQNNEQYLIKARLNVQNYLWFNQQPAILKDSTIPENYKNQFLPVIINNEAIDFVNHPVILAAINKLSYIEIDQRLKREKLKPKLKLKYNPLIGTSSNEDYPILSLNNFKWGFNFTMPLLFRTEKANLQKGAIKIQEIQLDLENKRNELKNKIESSRQQQQLLQLQINLISENIEGYKRLLDGENIKFNFGESSVFLLNKRQEKFINGQLKLIKTYIEQQIELLNYLYFSNQLLAN